MRRELRGVPVFLAMLLTASSLFATTGVGEPVPPVPVPDPISEALCGRESSESARAEALEAFDLDFVPEPWEKATVEDLRRWSNARGCGGGALDESSRHFKVRIRKIERILVKLDDTKAFQSIRGSILALAAKQPKPPDWSKPTAWPVASECPDCAAIRHAAIVAMESATVWRKQKTAGATIRQQLEALRQNEVLVATLCMVKPPATAAEEMIRRFRYYTWTADGAWLLEVARWFERPELLDRCGR